MTDIPEMYLAEAVRRLNLEFGKNHYTPDDTPLREVRVLADTLQELGWKPPVDEARMVKARKAAAAVFEAANMPERAAECRSGVTTPPRSVWAVYDALGEG